jgi:hypothetical protein
MAARSIKDGVHSAKNIRGAAMTIGAFSKQQPYKPADSKRTKTRDCQRAWLRIPF